MTKALWLQAMVRVRQGQVAEATQALEEGIVMTRDMPYPYAEARLLCLYGQLHM